MRGRDDVIVRRRIVAASQAPNHLCERCNARAIRTLHDADALQDYTAPDGYALAIAKMKESDQ